MTIQNRNLPIVLASTSKYREELLGRLNLPFKTIKINIDEMPKNGEAASATAVRLAIAKALAGKKIAPNAIVIAADQVLNLNGQQLGKPGNHENALSQLQKLRGQSCVFHTGLCVIGNADHGEAMVQTENVQTHVEFRDLSDEELNNYLKLERPYDCAGSAKNEGLGIAIIKRIETIDPTALTGLPLIALTSMLRTLNVKFFTDAD